MAYQATNFVHIQHCCWTLFAALNFCSKHNREYALAFLVMLELISQQMLDQLADPLMAKLTATSAVQRILPGQEGFQAEAQSSTSADN